MIGRTIPIALQADLSQAASTTCRILRIDPVEIPEFGITTLDRDIEVDGLIYRARRGYTASQQVASADLSVDNSEAEALLAEYPLDGVTADMIRRGVLDDARFVEYLVNYLAPENGKAIIGSGTIGELRLDHGIKVYIERRSLTQTLKQRSIIEAGSVNCRAQHGDERCKFPVDTLWDSAVVASVGTEADRSFTLDASGLTPGHVFTPGLVRWTSGANAGRTSEIEEATLAGGVLTVGLQFPADVVIAVGDEFDIRPDCNKWWGPSGTDLQGTVNNCLYWNNRLNFRGEPFRPVADSAALGVPGGAGGGASGTGSTQAVGSE